MKKKIHLPPVSASPFTGDCIRQNSLNRSVDEIIKKERSVHPARTIPPAVAKAGEILCGICLFATITACAYGVMAL